MLDEQGVLYSTVVIFCQLEMHPCRPWRIETSIIKRLEVHSPHHEKRDKYFFEYVSWCSDADEASLSPLFWGSRYSREEENVEELEETGWKYIHGDVFRFPPLTKSVTTPLSCTSGRAGEVEEERRHVK